MIVETYVKFLLALLCCRYFLEGLLVIKGVFGHHNVLHGETLLLESAIGLGSQVALFVFQSHFRSLIGINLGLLFLEKPL